MNDLSDQELLAAIEKRLENNRRALRELQAITGELEKTNCKLQESEALKSHFLSNIRNEINNPLTAIMGLAGRLMSGRPATETVQEIARMIFGEAFQLDFQLRNIFTAAELEAGEAFPAYARVDVPAVIDKVTDELTTWTSQKGVLIRKSAPKELFFITDAQKVHTIFLNLLANAVEFSPPGGTIHLAVAAADNVLEGSVRDAGPGIEPQARETVFDRFRQLDQGTAKNHRGHGLGLSVTRALLEIMGGEIELVDEVQGGCCVRLHLPESKVPVDTLAEDGNMFIFQDMEKF